MQNDITQFQQKQSKLKYDCHSKIQSKILNEYKQNDKKHVQRHENAHNHKQ